MFIKLFKIILVDSLGNWWDFELELGLDFALELGFGIMRDLELALDFALELDFGFDRSFALELDSSQD